MIVPYFFGILSFQKIPLTWCLVATNLCFYLLFAVENDRISRRLEPMINDPLMSETLGRVYHQYLSRKQSIHSPVVMKYNPEFQEQRMVLAQLALRDAQFYEDGLRSNFSGDPVEIARWKEMFAKYQELNALRPLSLYGLSSLHPTVLPLITYQFVHASFMHFLGNSLYALVFAGLIEVLMGSGWMLFLYLVGGVFGAFGYFLLSGMSPVPVVGASGSVTALMGASFFIYKKQRVRFFYFFAPSQGFYGFIYLPVIWILILSLIPDFTSFLIQPKELAGVAYAAHMGGGSFGLLFGYLYSLSFRWRKASA